MQVHELEVASDKGASTPVATSSMVPDVQMPGALNDINVLHRSPLMNKIAKGKTCPVEFVANGHTYNYGYYLADGIYPRCKHL